MALGVKIISEINAAATSTPPLATPVLTGPLSDRAKGMAVSNFRVFLSPDTCVSFGHPVGTRDRDPPRKLWGAAPPPTHGTRSTTTTPDGTRARGAERAGEAQAARERAEEAQLTPGKDTAAVSRAAVGQAPTILKFVHRKTCGRALARCRGSFSQRAASAC